MNPLDVVALGFDYPTPGSFGELRGATRSLPAGAVQGAMNEFIDLVGDMELGEWEELHTRTLDLSPLFVPYVGHVTWGENYRRGEFMADLQRLERDAGIDQAGELPDHIQPILRYLAIAERPPDDLIEVLPGAIAAMRKDLKQSEAKNPYRRLLAAVAAAVSAHLSEGAQV